jgi:hypothetical protein
MIAALLCVLLLTWNCWMMRHAGQVRPATASERRPARIVAASGLEDDPDQWRTGCGDWTALDQHQLIRLLTDSAP